MHNSKDKINFFATFTQMNIIKIIDSDTSRHYSFRKMFEVLNLRGGGGGVHPDFFCETWFRYSS